jgi:hypothetical protein
MSDVSSILVSDLLPQENFIIPTVNLSVSSRVERVHDIVKHKNWFADNLTSGLTWTDGLYLLENTI